MIGSTRAYDSYFDDDDDDLDIDTYIKKQKRKKIIIFTSILTIFILFLVFSIISVNTEDPTISYDLTERNDLTKDYTDPEILKEYYPE